MVSALRRFHHGVPLVDLNANAPVEAALSALGGLCHTSRNRTNHQDDTPLLFGVSAVVDWRKLRYSLSRWGLRVSRLS